MSSRDKILGRVRNSLYATEGDPARQATAAARIERHQRQPIPQRVAGKDSAALRQLFREQLESVGASVVDVADAADLPAAVSEYLRSKNLPQAVRMGADAQLATVPWANAPALEIASGRADPSDTASVSHAISGIAETGTLMLASGPDNPVTLNFLPETHIVVVDAKDVVGPYEDGFEKVRALFGPGQMPRTVNMISGPSRTGDIGGRIVMGAHGPRRMCVIVVENGL